MDRKMIMVSAKLHTKLKEWCEKQADEYGHKPTMEEMATKAIDEYIKKHK